MTPAIPVISLWSLAARLAIACLLGGAIGFQRESKNRPAGFRTHVLVCVGSALIMLVSMYGFAEVGQQQDPARIAAQVVSGIGFLGAGTIMKEGLTIKGLTTAASLWVVAAIGLAAGSGFFGGAIATTLLVYVALSTFGGLERFMAPVDYPTLTVVAQDEHGLLGRIGSFLGSKGISIRNICMSERNDEDGHVEICMELKLPSQGTVAEVTSGLLSISGILQVRDGT